MALIETRDLVKNYKNFTAVNGVSLHAEEGKVYGLIGKNGAGKTTILKIITGLTRASSGEVLYDRSRVRIGALIEAPGLYTSLTCFQNLKIKMLADGTFSEEKCMRLLALSGLSEARSRKAGALSLGMKQRLGIALALAGDPNVLILDEPINGLDPEGILDVRNLILRLKEEAGMTVIISSHILTELEKITDTYGILDRGTLLQEVRSEDLDEPIENRFISLTRGGVVLE